MTAVTPTLQLSTGPFVHAARTTPQIMRDVVVALVPVVAMAVWTFGIGALLLVGTATAAAVATEGWFSRAQGRTTLGDNSAALTGVLLGLTLPPGLPLWMAALGGVAAIGLGKLIWGGLGQNVFNPALVGRAFLQAAFPTALTSWRPPTETLWTVPTSLFAAPLMRATPDAISGATPLGMQKFDGVATELAPLALGHVGGSLGETSALLLLACGLWLAARRVFDWRLSVSTLLAVAVGSGAFHLVDGAAYPTPWFMLGSGGLMFAAVFMVTDPATTPTTPRGAWLFGLGVGALVVLIRLFGGLPEGVMYAILLMNAVAPHLERWTQPRRFGAAR